VLPEELLRVPVQLLPVFLKLVLLVLLVLLPLHLVLLFHLGQLVHLQPVLHRLVQLCLLLVLVVQTFVTGFKSIL
jgi:hypothetical protein